MQSIRWTFLQHAAGGYHDAAWGNAETDRGVGGRAASGFPDRHMIFAVHKKSIGTHGRELPESAVLEVARLQNGCRSLQESMACCEGLEAAIHLRSLLLSMVHHRVMSEEEAAQEIPIHAVTDCLSLYDYVHRCGSPKATADRRLVMEFASLRQMFMTEARGLWKRKKGESQPKVDDPMTIPLHWVSTEWQLSDILTKPLKPDRWWQTIRHPFFLAVKTNRRV